MTAALRQRADEEGLSNLTVVDAGFLSYAHVGDQVDGLAFVQRLVAVASDVGVVNEDSSSTRSSVVGKHANGQARSGIFSSVIR